MKHSKVVSIFLMVTAFAVSSCGKVLDGNTSDGVSLEQAAREGDAGSGGGSSVCTTCKIFVTASGFTGSLGGVAGADAKCMSDANYPGHGTYKAMIVDGSSRVACTSANCSGGTSEHTDWVLHPTTSYTRVDGTQIGTTTSAGIFSFPLSASISTVGNWTLTGLAATWTANGSRCLNWTSGVHAQLGQAGFSDHTDSGTIASATIFCDFATAGLFCVEQ